MASPKPPTVLITGCSAGGIGFALAREFHARGCHVFATARNTSKMQALAELPHVTLLALDVSAPASIDAAAAAVAAQTGGSLDVLVNNAGALYVTPALDGDLQKARAMFDVNVWGVAAVTQAFAPLLIAAKGGGSVANISSLAALMHTPYLGFYAASKAALQMFSETLRLELAPLGVRVVTVVTGAVESNVFVNAPPYRLPEGSLYAAAEPAIAARAAGKDVEHAHSTLDDYARAVVGDLLGGRAAGKIYRGKMASLANFLAGWMPAFVFDWLCVQNTDLDKVGKQKQL